MAGLFELSSNLKKISQPFSLGSYKPTPPRGRTQYEEEMSRFVAPVKEEEIKKRNRRTVWQVITDVLQIGNYASANVVNSIYDSIQYNKPLGEAAWDAVKSGFKGLTLQDKNTFSDIIKQNAEEHGEFLGKTLEEWEKPLWGDLTKGEKPIGKAINSIFGSKSGADVAGLAGDILLDPFTYINPLQALKPMGMASKGARVAGSEFADTMMKLNRMGTTAADLQGLASKTVGKKTGKEALEAVVKGGGRNAARNADLEFKALFKEGVLGTPEGLKARALGKAQQVQDFHLQKTMDELANAPYEDIPGMLENAGAPEGLDTLMQKITQQGFPTAGQRAFRVAGLGEVGRSAREPNRLAKGFGRLGDLIKSHGGGAFGDAWWKVVNGNSPVGLIKKALGVRNPYQQYLHVKELKGISKTGEALTTVTNAGTKALVDLGEPLKEKARSALAILSNVEHGTAYGVKQAASSQAALGSVLGAADDGVYGVRKVLMGVEDWDETIGALKLQGLDTKVFEDLKALNITPDEAKKIADFGDEFKRIMDYMWEGEKKLIDEGVVTMDEMGRWKLYLHKVTNDMPGVRKRAGRLTGSPTPGHMLSQTQSTRQAEREGIELLKVSFGNWIEEEAKLTSRRIDDVAREYMVKGNFAPISTDLVEIMNARITAHARVMGRGEIIKQFRELGIDQANLGLTGPAADAVAKMGDPFNKLVTSKDPALAGLLFDKDVSDIIDKSYALMASDDAMSGIKKLLMNYTSWWKGMATATTGFHLRNHFSNSVTGFFRHGMKWFDPRLTWDATVMSTYSLHPGNYTDVLTKQYNGMNEGLITKGLAKEYHGVTGKQWAEWMGEDGVVTTNTKIGTITKKVRDKVPIGERMTPWKEEFALPAGSRALGSAIENEARAKSYLLTVGELMDSGLDVTTARQYAALDTKKWFIDYSDLSEFEQQHLKGVIPFYTWIRKNLANQISGLLLQPEGYRLAAKAEDAVSMDEFDYTLIPEYMKQQGWLPVGQGEEGPTMWWPNFPYMDLNKIPLFWEEGGVLPKLDPKSVLEEFTASSHPAIKMLIQEATGDNMFRKREFLDRVPSPVGQVFVNSPLVVAFLDNAMKFMGFENGAGISTRNGKLEIDERLEQLMSVNVPLLRTIAKVFDVGLDVTGLEEVVEKSTGRKDPYQGMEDLFQNMSFFLGAKFRQEDESYRAEQLARDIRSKAEKDRSAWKQTMPGYEQRSLVNSIKYQAQSRRMGL